MTRTVYFVGVTTEGSRIHTLFPRWMARLGIDARIEGVDLPLDTSRDRYRELVGHIAGDPGVAGAVITTHKLALYDAAHTLFDEAEEFVHLCHEVDAVAKRGDTLVALARDPVASSTTLQAMLGLRYWLDHQADVLCFGAGGAGTAIALCLLADPATISTGLRPLHGMPRRVLFVDVDRDRLEGLRRVMGAVSHGARVEYICHADATENDALLASLPPASLIVNATGMGKDRPGSPLTDRAVFPQRAVVWDLNYRGSLTFLALARAQQEEKELQVHDGWLYFLHGWTQTLSPILGVNITSAVFRDTGDSPGSSHRMAGSGGYPDPSIVEIESSAQAQRGCRER